MLEETEYQLSEVGKFYDGPHATPTRTSEGPYFLNISSLQDGRLDLSQSDHLSDVDFAKWTKRVTPMADDLLFSYETRLGGAALMPTNVIACLGRRMALIRPNRDLANPRFLLYLFLSPRFKRLIEKNTIHGATVNRISLTTMPSWRIYLPALPEQRAIAEVLGALDDKIAANNKFAETADAYVRACFHGLPKESTVTLGELFDSERSQINPSDISAEVAYVGLEHIPRRSMWLDDAGISTEVTSAKIEFSAGDILFGKLRPYFHKVAVAASDGICSTDVLVLRPKATGLEGFALAAVADDAVVQAVTAASEGTRMPRTSWADLSKVEVNTPGESVAREFSNRVQELVKLVQSQINENRTLAEMRDTLLPQLMSGKLRVKDAETAAGAVL